MKRRIFLTMLAALAVATLMAQGRKELRFNEVMVVNDSSYIDQYGRHVPWVEIFNSSYGTVGMEQMFISNQEIPTDDQTLAKAGFSKPKDYLNDYAAKHPDICYEIPRGDADTRIAPRTHVVFFADGNTAAGARHLSYTLTPGRDNKLYLYDVNGDLVDAVTVPASLPAGSTYALKTDGQSALGDFNANDWSVNDGMSDTTAITPGKFNRADTNDNIEAFHKRDPYGVIIALMAMSVVFSALLILFLLFKLFGTAFSRNEKPATDEAPTAVAAPASASAGDEAIAAIAMALHEHLNAHDQESGIITISHEHESHGAWISKLNTMGHLPTHQE